MAAPFDTIRLRTSEVESLTIVDDQNITWTPRAGTLGVLVHEHSAGFFEAELFENEGDYAPVAMVVVREDQVDVVA